MQAFKKSFQLAAALHLHIFLPKLPPAFYWSGNSFYLLLGGGRKSIMMVTAQGSFDWRDGVFRVLATAGRPLSARFGLLLLIACISMGRFAA